MKEIEQIRCKIEHHATVFALFAKHIIKSFDERGKDIIYTIVENYGNERGKRMAERATKNGDDLDFLNSQAYCEWTPEKGQLDYGIIKIEPGYVTKVTQCEWCRCWKKHSLLEYGKYYCVNIDSAVMNGFNKNLHVTVASNLSFGADRCEIHFQNPISEEDIIKLTEKKAQLGESCIRDFNFHTAHLLHSAALTLRKEIAEDGMEIVKNVLEEYVTIFGYEYLVVLNKYYEEF